MLRSLVLASFAFASPAATPALNDVGPRLAEARSYASDGGEKIWRGYGEAPFGFLLVTEQQESLLCHPTVPDGFTPAGTDPATGCERYTRPRSELPDNLLAALPMFGPPAVIVMGTPQATERTEAAWVRTILHEHFHQWQNSLPDYYARAIALDLAGDDRTGMWMLNYPFPYESADVVEAHAAASLALADAVEARGTRDFFPRFDAYLQRRWALQAAAGADHWRYIEFQLWQEGVARWSEIVLGKSYPDAEVAASARELEHDTLAALRSPDLPGEKRRFVYAYGAAEAMLMDACGPQWRDHYPSVMAVGPLLNDARATCGRRT